MLRMWMLLLREISRLNYAEAQFKGLDPTKYYASKISKLLFRPNKRSNKYLSHVIQSRLPSEKFYLRTPLLLTLTDVKCSKTNP